jgi:hypothetical protein
VAVCEQFYNPSSIVHRPSSIAELTELKRLRLYPPIKVRLLNQQATVCRQAEQYWTLKTPCVELQALLPRYRQRIYLAASFILLQAIIRFYR